MSLNLLPQPGRFTDWHQWGRLLIQALQQSSGQTSGGSGQAGIPQVLTSKAVSAYGGNSDWPSLTPGEFMVQTKSVQSTSLIFVFPQGKLLGQLYEDKNKRIVGQSFVIKSTCPDDTPPVAWVIFQTV